MTNTPVLNCQLLHLWTQQPPRFEPGEPLFWDDPYISEQMLAAHLNPNTEAASRTPPVIEKTVNWMMTVMGLQPGQSLIDLGCGPGLYTSRLAQRGLHVTGVDYSRRSIDYANHTAAEQKLDITYRYQNYLTLEDENLYDAALLIYGDLCPLSPENQVNLLRRIHRALKPGGQFVLDVTTRQIRARHGLKNSWYVSDGPGFWKAGPHVVLQHGFDYPEHDTFLDQYIVIEADGRATVYRNWFLDYSPETIRPVLEGAGFAVRGVWNDLVGTPYTPDTEWIGLLAQKE
ncbi:MAG: class I SAM-dependent methyltransferase [Chloroflexi bacterium]|nr:class I SAM-dependent methyltransferase [Chloroflexota bacterium]